jgi:hypothetical protein
LVCPLSLVLRPARRIHPIAARSCRMPAKHRRLHLSHRQRAPPWSAAAPSASSFRFVVRRWTDLRRRCFVEKRAE